MKTILNFFKYLICYLFYPISFLIPRSKKILAFGSYRGAFNDNSKYLFLLSNIYKERLPQMRLVWISTDKKTTEYVRSLGLDAYYVGSLKGIYYALRAKYWFVNSYTSDIMFCLAGGATVVNLWHGVPMKCIEFGITQGELKKRYIDKEFWDVFFHPAPFRRPDYMGSTTPFFDDVFSKSFRISKEQCIHIGCPRNLMLNEPKDAVEQFAKKYEPQHVNDLIAKLKQFSKVYVYMPTWRDSQANVFANGFDLEKFNNTLKAKNAIALMKPHVNTIIDNSKEYSNLLFINNKTDMYCILPFTDVLITDYSGTIYDYLLMQDKGVILFHYDYDEYVKEREFIFPIEHEITGKRVYNFDELIAAIKNDNDKVDEAERKRIVEKFWGNTMLQNETHDRTWKHIENIFKQIKIIE